MALTTTRNYTQEVPPKHEKFWNAIQNWTPIRRKSLHRQRSRPNVSEIVTATSPARKRGPSHARISKSKGDEVQSPQGHDRREQLLYVDSFDAEGGNLHWSELPKKGADILSTSDFIKNMIYNYAAPKRDPVASQRKPLTIKEVRTQTAVREKRCDSAMERSSKPVLRKAFKPFKRQPCPLCHFGTIPESEQDKVLEELPLLAEDMKSGRLAGTTCPVCKSFIQPTVAQRDDSVLDRAQGEDGKAKRSSEAAWKQPVQTDSLVPSLTVRRARMASNDSREKAEEFRKHRMSLRKTQSCLSDFQTATEALSSSFSIPVPTAPGKPGSDFAPSILRTGANAGLENSKREGDGRHLSNSTSSTDLSSFIKLIAKTILNVARENDDADENSSNKVSEAASKLKWKLKIRRHGGDNGDRRLSEEFYSAQRQPDKGKKESPPKREPSPSSLETESQIELLEAFQQQLERLAKTARKNMENKRKQEPKQTRSKQAVGVSGPSSEKTARQDKENIYKLDGCDVSDAESAKNGYFFEELQDMERVTESSSVKSEDQDYETEPSFMEKKRPRSRLDSSNYDLPPLVSPEALEEKEVSECQYVPREESLLCVSNSGDSTARSDPRASRQRRLKLPSFADLRTSTEKRAAIGEPNERSRERRCSQEKLQGTQLSSSYLSKLEFPYYYSHGEIPPSEEESLVQKEKMPKSPEQVANLTPVTDERNPDAVSAASSRSPANNGPPCSADEGGHKKPASKKPSKRVTVTYDSNNLNSGRCSKSSRTPAQKPSARERPGRLGKDTWATAVFPRICSKS